MESLLKTLGLLLYIALFPLLAITEILIDLFVFVKYIFSLKGRIRVVGIKAIRVWQSVYRYRISLPWSLGKQ